jgi:DNA polymerase III alpha subunit (gram-positive type)
MNFIELLKNEYIRGALILVVGITIGVIFYPSKRIEEKLSTTHQEEIVKLKEQHSKEVQKLSQELDVQLKENKELHITTEKKINSLTSQVSELKSKQKVSTYKLVKPDGTIEERTFSESEVDQSTKTVTKIQEEFKQKVDSIESKWSKIHEQRVSELKKEFDSKEQEYKKQIDTLEKSRVVTTNEKKFGVEIGVKTNKDYYGHLSMDLWGPVFVGVHGELNKDNDSKLGAGIGVRF